MAGLQKEIWTKQLMTNFYPDSSFLKYVKDMSELVEFDKINMAEVGLDPEVLINNTTYPIPTIQRVDKAIAIELDTFETKNTLIRRPEDIEYSTSQLETVLMGHRNSLRATTAEKAAHAIAPQADGEFSPVIKTSGSDDGSGRKAFAISDLLELKRRFDEAEIPMDKRYVVLNPKHVRQLLSEDLQLFKDISNYKDGELFRFAGFNMMEFTRLPKYDVSNGTKIAFGAAETTNDTYCSIAFHGPEVMKADGSTFMYADENNPAQRGTIVGFDKRFISMPIRNKGIGAIISDAV